MITVLFSRKRIIILPEKNNIIILPENNIIPENNPERMLSRKGILSQKRVSLLKLYTLILG